MPYIYIYTYPSISLWKASLCLIRRWFKVFEFLWDFRKQLLFPAPWSAVRDFAERLGELPALGGDRVSGIDDLKKKGFNTSTSFNHWVNHWALSQVFHQIITVQWVQHHWVFSQRTCNAWRNNIVFPQHIAAKHVTKQVLEQPPR